MEVYFLCFQGDIVREYNFNKTMSGRINLWLIAGLVTQ